MDFPVRLLSPVGEYLKDNSLSIYLAAGALIVVLAALFIAKAILSSRGKRKEKKAPPEGKVTAAEKLPETNDTIFAEEPAERNDPAVRGELPAAEEGMPAAENAATPESPDNNAATPESPDGEDEKTAKMQPALSLPPTLSESADLSSAEEDARVAEGAKTGKIERDKTASAPAENLPTDAFDKQDETASAPRGNENIPPEAENIPPEKETEKEEFNMKKKDETAKKTAAEKSASPEPAKKSAKKTANAPARMKARVAETVPAKPAPAKEKPAEAPVSTGMHGKWRIAETEDGFVASLYASNGVLMLNSEAYTTEKGAKNGIDTIKKNAENGIFQIKQDKNGRFNFKLFSLQKRLICIGASYPTRSSCESAIESVKNFAKTAILVPNAPQEPKAE